MAPFHHMRLLNVVEAVSDAATSDDETLATVASLINSGKIQFCGDLAGATIKGMPRLNPCPETPDKEMAHASTSMV